MSYRIRISPIDNRKPKWYINSFEPILADIQVKNRHDRRPHAVWEKTYGYEIKFDKWGFAIGVEFPSEAEATMFMLRWS